METVSLALYPQNEENVPRRDYCLLQKKSDMKIIVEIDEAAVDQARINLDDLEDMIRAVTLGYIAGRMRDYWIDVTVSVQDES